MSQQQICDVIEKEYDIPVHRATIKRNIDELMDAGYGIRCTKKVARSYTDRETGDKEENIIYKGLYYQHDFTESELHMIIDGLLFSRSVPYKERKALIKKLCDLNSTHFSKRIEHVHSMSADAPQNPKLFENIQLLDEAIAKGKQVEITYGYFGTDMKLHETLNEDGTVKKHLLNPYQLVASEGKYYLICNKENYDNVVNYRVDRITGVRILETAVKAKNRVNGLEDGLKLEKYLFQHVNMFAGEPEEVEFIVPKKNVSLVIDFFGTHVSYFPRPDGTYSCRLQTSREAMKHWAAQFAAIVRVVSPPELVEEVREEIRKFARQYDMKEI